MCVCKFHIGSMGACDWENDVMEYAEMLFWLKNRSVSRTKTCSELKGRHNISYNGSYLKLRCTLISLPSFATSKLAYMHFI